MIIKIKANGFNETGKLISIKVTRKKINGVYGERLTLKYLGEAFFPYDDIQIVHMTDEEKQMPVEI